MEFKEFMEFRTYVIALQVLSCNSLSPCFLVSLLFNCREAIEVVVDIVCDIFRLFFLIFYELIVEVIEIRKLFEERHKLLFRTVFLYLLSMFEP